MPALQVARRRRSGTIQALAARRGVSRVVRGSPAARLRDRSLVGKVVARDQNIVFSSAASTAFGKKRRL